jgi:cbb3-type cytochrome oxidase maturation protein
MEILVLLIPLSVVLVFLIGAAFWWAVDDGQFDNAGAAAESILRDDDRADADLVPGAVPARGHFEAMKRVDSNG